MSQRVVFSASSVNAYLECQLRWWFEYVLAIQKPPSEAQAVGIAVHEAAEVLLKQTQGVQYPRVYAANTGIIPLVEVFTRDVLPTYGKVMLVEQEFQMEVNGIPFGGTVDSLDRHDAPLGVDWDAEGRDLIDPYPTSNSILRDLKTTASRPSNGRYRTNMVGYFIGVTEGLGYEVNSMMLDYIVRTKTPYYWPEVQEIPDQDEIDGWAARLERVAEMVDKGEFEPTGLGTAACNWCHFKEECGPFQRYTAISPLRS